MQFLRHLYYFISYLGNPPWETGVSPPELLDFIRAHPPGRALDLGCGTGTNTITLAQHGWQVTGVDFIGKAVRQARRKAVYAGVSADFRQGDITRLDNLPDHFDLILDMGCFHSLSPYGKTIYSKNLARWLSPGGTFLLYAFITSPENSLTGVSEADLASLCSSLELIDRKDGSERGRMPSAWFTFKK